MKPNLKKAKLLYEELKKTLVFHEQNKWNGDISYCFIDIEELIYLNLFPEKLNDKKMRRSFVTAFRNTLKSERCMDFEAIQNMLNTEIYTKQNFKVIIFLYISKPFKGNFLFQKEIINNVKFEWLGKSYKGDKHNIGNIHENIKNDYYKYPKLKDYILRSHYILAETDAYNAEEAVTQIEESFDLIRAAYNFCVDYGISTQQLGPKRSLSKLKRPVSYLVRDKEIWEPFYLDEVRFDDIEKSKYIPLVDAHQLFFIKLLTIFKKAAPSIVEKALIQCVYQISEAFDSISRDDKFLNFYRVCEFAVGINIKRDHNEVMDLIAKFYNDPVSLDQAKKLTFFRNQLVHRNIFNHGTDIHLNWVREFAEKGIRILHYLVSNDIHTSTEFELFWPLYKKYRDGSLEQYKVNLQSERKIINLLLIEECNN